MTTERAQRMIASAPDYYETSVIYTQIQQAQADDYDGVETDNEDLRKQLTVFTATWGLKYWEERVGLPVSTDSYEIRRSRILSRLRSVAPFSASMLEAVVGAYTQRPVTVEIDTENYEIIFVLDSEFMVDAGLLAHVDNVIHAHLGVEYRGKWLYSSSFTLEGIYQRWNYPYTMFTGPYVTGTGPAGAEGVPSTLGRAYANQDIDLSRSAYYTGQQPYKLAAQLLAGGYEVGNNISKTYNSSESLSSVFSKSTKAYLACSTTLYCGTGVLI